MPIAIGFDHKFDDTGKDPEPKKISDDTPMPFGKHKGTKLKDVPAHYLLWAYDEDWFEKQYPKIWRYIDLHFDLLCEEVDDYKYWKHGDGAKEDA